jgi:hypothetical protein
MESSLNGEFTVYKSTSPFFWGNEQIWVLNVTLINSNFFFCLKGSIFWKLALFFRWVCNVIFLLLNWAASFIEIFSRFYSNEQQSLLEWAEFIGILELYTLWGSHCANEFCIKILWSHWIRSSDKPSRHGIKWTLNEFLIFFNLLEWAAKFSMSSKQKHKWGKRL